MKTTKRVNAFFIADLIICGLALLFASKHIGVFHYPMFFSLFVSFVPVLLRVNIGYWLSRNEKSVGGSLLAFVVFSLWGISTVLSFDSVLDKMGNWVSYGLMALGITDSPFYHVGNYQYTTDVVAECICNVFVWIALCWFYVLPIILYVIKLFGNKLAGNAKQGWANVFCAFGEDKQMQKYIVYFAFVFVAFMVGLSMPTYGWTLTIMFLPLLAYYVINKLNGYSSRTVEYVLLEFSIIILWHSQFYRDEWRIIGLIVNAALIVCLCLVLSRKIKTWRYAVLLSLYAGFMLPNLALGYNIYTETHTSRHNVFTTSLSHSGVLRVKSDRGYGLRDRHRIILEAEYDAIYVEDYHSDHIRVRKNDVWMIYDVTKESWVEKSTSRIENTDAQTKNDTISLSSKSMKTYKLKDYLFEHMVGSAPQNEQIKVYDKHGRLLAMAARASELTYFEYFKYLYDSKGKHVGFSTLWEEADDYPFMTDSVLPFNDREYDVNCLYYDIVERKHNDRYVERYHFVWDGQGNMVKVYDPVTGKKLVAPSGKKLKYKLEEGGDFWASDIRGGDYHLMFYLVPIDSAEVNTDTIVFEGYEPYVESEI